jgi:hypothetical protein
MIMAGEVIALMNTVRAAGLVLVMACAMATGTSGSPEKKKPIDPAFRTVNLRNSDLGQLRDKDPKVLVIRAFVHRPDAFVEGLRRELISVTYVDSGRQATVVYEDSGGSLDESIASSRYVSNLQLDGGLWRLRQARLQWICREGRGHQDWSAHRCR